MLSVPITIGLALSIIATSFLSGLFGMAGGMVLMGLLLVLLPVPAAMVLHGVTQVASNGARAWLWRTHIIWRLFAAYFAGAVLALALFAAIRFIPSKAMVLIFIGLAPLTALAMPDRLMPNLLKPTHAAACGFICTVLQLVAGVSGPIFDAFFVKSGMDRKAQVSTKAAAQTFGHFVKLVYFGTIVASDESYVAPAVMAIAVATAIIGTWLSRRILEGMTDRGFRLWSQRIIVTISAVYLGQGLWLAVAS
ncbi:MAG: sulfite exporter TauE/SafE family protein [Alphaproteobacteria bacterium]|nr:sulfite exporter TauE/SafE family protein [Alphaproteobacteria bacterium]